MALAAPTELPKTVNIRAIADILGVEDRRIQQLVAAGTIPTPEVRGEYLLIPCVRAYCDFLRGVSTSITKQMAAENLKKAQADAEMAQMDRDYKKERILRVSEVNEAYQEFGAAVREEIASLEIPHKAKIALAKALGEMAVEKILQKRRKAEAQAG